MEIKPFLIKEIITNSNRLNILNEILDEFSQFVVPKMDYFRKSNIQNDPNASNIIINKSSNCLGWDVSFIDFLDIVETCSVFNIAISLAYLMQLSSKPLEIAKILLGSYHEEFPLSDEEIQVLPILIKARLAVSVTICARKLIDEPNNEYLPINFETGWKLLEFLSPLGSENFSNLLSQYCQEK